MSDDFSYIKVKDTPSQVKGAECFQDRQSSQKKLFNFIFRLRRLAVCVCVHAWKCKQSQEAWNCRPQRPNWTNKLWNSQGPLSQEKIRQGGKIKKEHISIFFTFVELAGLCVTSKGLRQHWLPAWNHSVTTYMLPSLWFLHWKVFAFSSPCPPNYHHSTTHYTLSSLPLSPAHCFHHLVWGTPQCTFSLLYRCKSDLGVGCLWMLIHAE